MTETEQDYVDHRNAAVEKLVEMLQAGDELGKEQTLMAAEFMAAFQVAAQRVFDAKAAV